MADKTLVVEITNATPGTWYENCLGVRFTVQMGELAGTVRYKVVGAIAFINPKDAKQVG